MNCSKQLFFATIVAAAAKTNFEVNEDKSFVFKNPNPEDPAKAKANIILSFKADSSGETSLVEGIKVKLTNQNFKFVDVKSELLSADAKLSDAFDTNIVQGGEEVQITFKEGIAKKTIKDTESITISADVKDDVARNAATSVLSITVPDSSSHIPITISPMLKDSSIRKAFDWGKADVKSKIGLLTSTKYFWRVMIVKKFWDAVAFVETSASSLWKIIVAQFSKAED